ncbi:MAG: DUF433 domain-containing protein [Planctomycetota bacterium]
MAQDVSLDQRIEATPGVCGGKPRLAGRRIRVQDIVAWYEYHGMTPDEIVSGYPQITLADVHAALAYYHAHRAEIQQQMQEDAEFADGLRQADPRATPQPPDPHGDPLSS